MLAETVPRDTALWDDVVKYLVPEHCALGLGTLYGQRAFCTVWALVASAQCTVQI